MKITKIKLKYLDQKTNAFIFLPDGEKVEVKPTLAIFTHGYTSQLSSLLSWATKLCEEGVACLLFDLPGHYLGNDSEVLDFDYFKNHVHELFYDGFLILHQTFLEEFPTLKVVPLKVILGGHSLGGLLSLKALKLKGLQNFQKLSIAVGLGLPPKNVTHILETKFFENILKVRSQLVSPALSFTDVFPWIKEEKEQLDLKAERVHLITGIDDVVVGADGMERLAQELILKNNEVSFEKPSRLPHYEPELAAGLIKKYLKKIQWI